MDVPTLGIAILAVIAVPLLTTLYIVVVEWLIRGLSEKRRAKDPTMALAPPRRRPPDRVPHLPDGADGVPESL